MKLLVMGGGVMGQGIARLFANGGVEVTLAETREITFLHPGVTVARVAPPAFAPDLVIEAVFEQRDVKQAGFDLIEDGIADADMIDKVAKHLLGPRMCITGLLEQKDLAGLTMHAQAQQSIVPTLSHTNVPNRYLQDMVERGDLGIATGKGFYDWSARDGAAAAKRAGERLKRLLEYLATDAAE